jgi:hypothetical protein
MNTDEPDTTKSASASLINVRLKFEVMDHIRVGIMASLTKIKENICAERRRGNAESGSWKMNNQMSAKGGRINCKYSTSSGRMLKIL